MAANPYFAMGPVRTITIASGQTGVNNAGADFDNGYAFFQVTIEDAAGIPSSTTIRALAGFTHVDSLASVRESNDPGTQWSKNLPTSGKHTFRFDHAFGAQRLSFILSAAATANVVLTIRPFDRIQPGH